MKALHFASLLISTTALCLTQNVYAGGFQYYELGTPIIGTAGVGQAAVAIDASTAYFNPAGMAVLPGTELMLGIQSILPYINFSPNSRNTITGDNGGNAGNLIPGLGAFFVYAISPQFKIGASLTGPFGGMENYNNRWVGRYEVQQITFYSLNLNPVVSYQINDWAAIGAGFSIEYANLYQTVAVPIIGSIDGQITVKVANTSPGFNLGVLFTPYCETKIGIAYRSQIIHRLHGDISFMNLAITPNVTTKLVDVAGLIASISHPISEQFTILGELGWANWSSMKNTTLTVDQFTSTTVLDWHDTYRIGLGGQFHYRPDLMFQTGISYDSSPTTSSRRLPQLPADRQIRVGVGLEYEFIRAVMLGLSYEYLNLGKAKINNVSPRGVFSGDYSRNFANVFQASLNVAC